MYVVSGCLPYFRMCFRMLALFPDVFPDACSDLDVGHPPKCVDPKNNLWAPLSYLASGESKISNKTRPWRNTHAYI